MTERAHAHTQPSHASRRHDVDLAPGAASRSAQLDAPLHPVISGLLQRKARDANGVAADADQAVASAASSSGFALPAPLMRKFETSLGADLSGVRVHTGAESAAAASAVGAKAYTMGQDIHFGAGHYDPSSAAGQHLLAHEVAHTVQQAGGAASGRQNKLEVSAPGDALEHEADRAADAMVTGQGFDVSTGSGMHRTAFRDRNFTPGPVPPAEEQKTETASEQEKQAARQGVMSAQTEALNAISNTLHQAQKALVQYVLRTAEDPAVVWEPTLLRHAIATWATKSFGVGIGVASTAAAEIPVAGAIIAWALPKLGGLISDKLKEKIEGGKKLAPDVAGSKSRDAALKPLLASLDRLHSLEDAQKKDIAPHYQRQLDRLAPRDMTKADVSELLDWSKADIAASRSVKPDFKAMYSSMLMSWIVQNAADAENAKDGVNKEDFKKANEELGLSNTDFWALELRREWLAMGLPTDQADAWIRARYSVDDQGNILGLGDEVRTATFTTAHDLDKLARSLFPARPNRKSQHIVNGGAFRLTCSFRVTAKPTDWGATYYTLGYKAYVLETSGMPDENRGETKPLAPRIED
jgi:hypothetical protein